jgi:hypothetical protein
MIIKKVSMKQSNNILFHFLCNLQVQKMININKVENKVQNLEIKNKD